MRPQHPVSSRLFVAIVAAAAAAAGLGCGAFDPPPTPPPFKATVIVTGDPGEPLLGAVVSYRKGEPAMTGADGRVELVFHGADGDVREVTVACPPGHQQAGNALQIRLTRLASTQLPEYQVSCPPLRRKVVVAVRADNGPFLPVKYLNEVVATTDEAGAAHFALTIEPGSFSVALDTSDRKDLKPPSPARVMTVGQQDDVLVFDQRFEVQKKRVYVKPIQRPVRL
jgi:hypothetical protein